MQKKSIITNKSQIILYNLQKILLLRLIMDNKEVEVAHLTAQQTYFEIEQQSSRVFVHKEREEEYDEKIANEWKGALINFYTKQIPSKLSEAKANEAEIAKVSEIFINEWKKIKSSSVRSLTWTIQKRKEAYKYKYKNSRNETVELLKKFQKQLEELKESLQKLNNNQDQQKRQYVQIQRIIQMKLINLKLIHIQYRTIIGKYDSKQYRYCMEASKIFKFVNQNKLLKEAIFKGIKVQNFTQFLMVSNPLNNDNETKDKRENFNWIGDFRPMKSLKLTVNAQLKFEISQKKDISSLLNDLTFFISSFQEVSQLNIRIMLGEWRQIGEWAHKLTLLFKCLQPIKKINLKIWQIGFLNYIPDQVVSLVRSVLFGGLASLTTIKDLQLEYIYFKITASSTHLQAMEYILEDLFQNNIVTYLKISHCNRLPVFPCINTLQEINLLSANFRKQYGFLNKLTYNNKDLKSINGSHIQEQWTINKYLFSQLQTLIVLNCTKILLQNDLPPSKMRHFSVGYSSIGSIDNLRNILPKLFNLTYLRLISIEFDYQLLSTIPSPHLEELHIKFNNQLTNQDLMNIDSKWPNLRQLQLFSCENVTEEAWKLCELRGLKMLEIDYRMLGEGYKALQPLLRKGIKVGY